MNKDKIYLQYREEKEKIFNEISFKAPISDELRLKISYIKDKHRELMKSDEYVHSMFKCEMYNSDYFSGESDDLVLDNCGLPEDILWHDERLKKIYLKVRQEYMEKMEEYYS